jgi:heme iron utilization protein
MLLYSRMHTGPRAAAGSAQCPCAVPASQQPASSQPAGSGAWRGVASPGAAAAVPTGRQVATTRAEWPRLHFAASRVSMSFAASTTASRPTRLLRLRRLRNHMQQGGTRAHASARGGADSGSEQGEGMLRVVPSREGHRVAAPPPGGQQGGRRGSASSATRYLENDAPKPTHAEKSRTMLQRLSKGVLCTMHQELGYPYGSTINLACDEMGQPFTFVSTMAEHTANLLTSSKCSVVVTETQGTGDQLAQARMTLVGDMTPTDKTEALKEQFLGLHPSAFYVDFEDFLCMR